MFLLLVVVYGKRFFGGCGRLHIIGGLWNRLKLTTAKAFCNLYTNNIPVPGAHVASGKTPKKYKKPFTGKKGRNLQERNRGGSLSRMDRSNRCHVYRMKRYRVT